MNVSSYLDAFLAVYGWESYYSLYLALAAMGLFLYPLLRASLEIYVDYASNRSSYRDHTVIKRLITTIVMMFIVFFMSMIPMVEISFDKMRAKQVCAAGQSLNDVNQLYNNSKFIETDRTRVPIIPWLAMAIGNALSAVVYETMPCALDVTEARKNNMNVSLDNAENPHELKSEFRRYMNECQTKIRNVVLDIYNNKRDTEFGSWLREEVREVSKKERGFWKDLWLTDTLKEHEELAILYSPDSELIKQIFFDGTVNPRSSKVRAELDQLRLSFVANSPVTGFTGANNGSSVQGNETPPSCSDWWQGQGGTEGLRTRLVSALSDDIVAKQGNELGVPECRIKPYGPGNPSSSGVINKAACRQKIINDIYKGDEEGFAKSILYSLQNNYTQDNIVSGTETAALTTLVALDAAGQFIAKSFGIDVGNGVIKTIVSFYASLYMLKLMLRNLLPMIMMSIYMFWGIYMVVGAFKGETIIKGFILIASLTLVPSLWALIDHLDDKLWDAMYDGASGSINPVGMAVLDAATSLFQVGIVFILFHMVALAGGGNASGAVSSSQNMAQGTSSKFMSGGAFSLKSRGIESIQKITGSAIQKTGNALKNFRNK